MLTAHGRSEVGHVRTGNEDAWFAGTTVFVVADGLGGHAGGEVASALATGRLAALDGRPADSPAAAQRALAAAIGDANDEIRAAGRRELRLAGMGTTLTAAAIVDGVLALAHVGDSRAYLRRAAGGLERLTTDHSVVGELVASGRLTPAQARVHPERMMLTQALGLDDRVRVDCPTPLELGAGDLVLLCSDGLTEVLDDPDIERLLGAAPDPRAACDALIGAVLDGGAPDNVTVVVVQAGRGKGAGSGYALSCATAVAPGAARGVGR